MPRPQVQIFKPNQRDTLLEHLYTNLPQFTAVSGVVGITLNGGLSRGYGDHLSEIDITFYLDSDTNEHWQQGNAPYGNGIQRINGELYDIKFVDLKKENAASWSSNARWDASYAQVLYDPNGAIRDLLSQNEAYRPSPSDASGVMFSAWWYFKLAGDIWIYRDDPLQAHLMLNQAMMEIVKAVYIANREFIPHEKWIIHMSRSLNWAPNNWIPRITGIMCNLSSSTANVKVRQEHIEQLWMEIDQHIVATLDKPYPLQIMYKRFYDLLVMLLEETSIPVEQWQEISDLSLLNSSPFNLCVHIENDHVVFSRQNCASITSEDLYAWHFTIVKAIQSTLR